MPVVLSASRKGFGVFGEGRKADSKRLQSVPASTEVGLAEEGGGCLERKPRRGQTGAGTGTVTLSALSAQASWAECDDGHGVTVTEAILALGRCFSGL